MMEAAVSSGRKGWPTVILLGAMLVSASCGPEANRPESAKLALQAEALVRQGHYSDAVSLLRQSIQLDPENRDALLQLANVFAHLDLVDSAVIIYRNVLDLDDENAEAHNNLGNMLGRQSKLDEAMNHFEAAVHLNPKLAAAQFNLGHALFLKGDFVGAENRMRQAVNLKPDDPKFLEGIGLLYLTTGKVPDAVATFEILVRQDTTIATNRRRLGLALAENGHYTAAIGHLSAFLRLSDDREEKTIVRNKIFEIKRLERLDRLKKTNLP